MKHFIHNTAWLLCAVLLPAQVYATTAGELQTVSKVDVQQYMGTWYEIAKYPNRFQKQCVANTQAQYRLLPDGDIQVINRCLEAGGRVSEAIGQARQIGPADSPRLKVRFAPSWLSFLPMVWGDYWIIDLDENYQWVAVSEPQREYLWVLSRQPQMEASVYQALLQRLQAKGFDLQKIETSVQQ